MSNRAYACQSLKDKDVDIFHATAPFLATICLPLLAFLAGMGVIATLAWQNGA